MKSLLLFIFLLICKIGLSQDIVYSTPKFEIKYPASWKLNTSKIAATELMIVAPMENENDKIGENVSLRIQKIKDRKFTMATYKEFFEEGIKSQESSSKIFHSSIVKLDGMEYFDISYEEENSGYKIIVNRFCFIKHKKLYSLSLNVEADKFEQYRETGMNILKSFQFK